MGILCKSLVARFCFLGVVKATCHSWGRGGGFGWWWEMPEDSLEQGSRADSQWRQVVSHKEIFQGGSPSRHFRPCQEALVLNKTKHF